MAGLIACLGARRTHNCDNHPSSVACMACAQNMPAFTVPAHVVPIGARPPVLRCRTPAAPLGNGRRIARQRDLPVGVEIAC